LKRKPPILLQLTFGFTAILLVVMSVTGLVTYMQASRSSLDQTSQLLLDSVRHLSGKLDANLMEYDKTIQMLSFNPVIQNHLMNPSKSGLFDSDVTRLMNESNRTSGHESNIMLVDSFGENYLANSSMDFLWRTEEQMRKQPWYDDMSAYHGRMLWFSGLVWVNGATHAIIGARDLNHIETLHKIGTIVFAYPAITLEKTVGTMDLGQNGKVQVVDRFGRVLYSTNLPDIGTPAPSSVMNRLEAHPHDMISIRGSGSTEYISYAHSEYSGLTVLAYIDREEVYAGVSQLQQTIFWIGVAGLSAGILFITVYSWTIVRPIRFLAKRFEMIDDGHLRPFRGQLWNDEVSALYDSYNRMMLKLKQTIQDLSDKQISERQAQFVALRAQFRPHFLYNTLNTIYWTLEGKRDAAAAAEMVQLLSELLRYSIQPGSELTTIGDDVAQLNRYLALQKSRYGDKVVTEMHIEEELLECQCMKLLLQPIVENAMTHGLEGVKRAQWLIRIRIERDGDDIRFIVDDNGKGLSEREMKEMLEADEREDKNPLHTGIGLPNLQQRLQLIHGKAYGIQLSDNEWGGLRVTVTIPMLPAHHDYKEVLSDGQ